MLTRRNRLRRPPTGAVTKLGSIGKLGRILLIGLRRWKICGNYCFLAGAGLWLESFMRFWCLESLGCSLKILTAPWPRSEEGPFRKNWESLRPPDVLEVSNLEYNFFIADRDSALLLRTLILHSRRGFCRLADAPGRYLTGLSPACCSSASPC